MRRLLNFVPILAVFIAHFGSGQPAASASCYNGGSLYIICNHVRWPSPESVADSLRSSDEQTRLAALHEMGLVDRQIFQQAWSQSTPSRLIGKKLVTPDEVQLTYAALGDSSEKEAILAVFISQEQIAALAVATPVPGGWERIAHADCWCKYDMYNGIDALATFVQLEPAPGSPSPPLSFELVVRASGGGSGVYAQTETRFRVHNGDLTQVFSFSSRHRNCNGMTNKARFECTATRRWLYPVQLGKEPGEELVEASGGFNGEAPAFGFIHDLEITKLHVEHCTAYRWDEQRFQYEKAKDAPDPCKRPGEKGGRDH